MNMLSLSSISRTLEDMSTSSHIEDADLWQITLKNENLGEKTHQMINYISFGIDAEITKDYEMIRRAFRPLLCFQFMSKCLFVPAGAMNVFGKRSLRDYISCELDESRKVELEEGEKTIIFMSTETIYGGRKLWKSDDASKMTDGKLEVVIQKGISMLIMSNIGINLTKSSGQAESVTLVTKEPITYQIDGEAFECNEPTTFRIERKTSYPLIFTE